MDEPSSPEGNAITLRIKFKSASLDEFVARYGADVSAGGIFIRTRQPLTVGTALHFDFSLGDGTPLMAGMGTVVWVREADASRVGSVPGMGVRFDQLTPEGQQIHLQILGLKAKRQERPAGGSPVPGAPFVPSTSVSPRASVSAPPAARPGTPVPPTVRPGTPVSPTVRPGTPVPPTVRPGTPVPPAAARPMASASVAPPSQDSEGDADDFGAEGKTEIADRPPSFYFDAVGKKPVEASAVKPTSKPAVPTSSLDDAETDSRRVPSPEPGAPSQPVDLGEGSGGLSAPIELLDADSKATQASGSSSASIIDLPPAGGSSAPASGNGGEVPLTVGKESSWLNDALKATSEQTAVPEAAPNEPTQETIMGPGATVPETPALVDETAGVATSGERAVEGDLSEMPTEHRAARSGRSGKTLIIVGSVAACLAFAGVYLWMAKPWENQTAPAQAPLPTPAAPTVAVPPPAAEPAAPAANPAAAEPVKAAEPAKAAEPIKPAEPAEPPKPAAAPEAEKPQDPAAEPGKTEPAVETGKRSGTNGKKPSSKSPAAPAPSAPVPTPAPAPAGAEKPAAAPADLIYVLKVKSVPLGAHVIMDGDPMGTTPFQRRILDIDKPHSILVRKPGFDSYERTVTKTDFGAPSGNTSTLSLSAKLTKLRTPPGAAAPAPVEAAPAPEQPEKL